jgi:hypothetical protein
MQVGDWVWVLRPKSSSVSKVDTWWVGPVKITRRVGAMSYDVDMKEGTVRAVHQDQLKPWVGGESINLYHFQPGYHIQEVTPDDRNVEAVLGHRKGPQGQLLFRTKWEGERATTWEPPGSFFRAYNHKLIKYCQDNSLSSELVGQLRIVPSPEDG